MNILGISCYYHDAAACLIKDGEVIAAAQEERFNRNKYSPDFPINAINFCLQQANFTIEDIDEIGFYEKPYLKFERFILNHLKAYPFSLNNFIETMPNWLKDRLIVPLIIRNELSYDGRVFFIKHHLAHAASSFFVSPFEDAAVLTVDGVGEWATASYGFGKVNNITILKELQYPHSLGLLYSIITTYLGFRVFSGEGKVMALAEYGAPVYLDKFKQEVVDIKPDGSFALNPKYFCFNKGARMYSNRFIKLFGKPRKEEAKIEDRHKNMAATLQKIAEEILVLMARHVYNETKINKLCLAGGVFLNVTANSKILEKSPFKEVFIQPASGDSGAALGAAAYVYHCLLGNPRNYVMKTASFGPNFSDKEIKRILINKGLNFKEVTSVELTKYVAEKIAQDKIIGWFQGRMEWGPRALGNRSILANPCNPRMRDILNTEVKHRDSFRPYGVSTPLEEMPNFFDLKTESPFMLLVGTVKPEKKELIPSAVHVNGTSRIQTVTKEHNGIYYDLIKEFEKITGIPMLINTSFNDEGQPIVCTAEEACNCFLKTKIDCLVMGNYIVEKNSLC